MAHFTLELRHIIENGVNIFDFDYDFYDETAKAKFEQDFIRHFYFREIGTDTVARFKWYLNDKMQTVFPYYNSLFKSATIEYSILDNYNLKETYSRTVKNDSTTHGINSQVNQAIDDQTADVTSKTTVDGKTTNTEDIESTSNVTETLEGEKTIETDETKSLNGTSAIENEHTNNMTGSNSSTSDKRFLDTPQGKVTLSDSKYVTTVNLDTVTGSNEQNTNENTTENKTTTESGTNNVDTTENTDETKTAKKTTEQGTTQSGTEETTTDGESHSVTNSNHKSTNDSNSKVYQTGEQVEEYTLNKRGNIGIDTDADMITKHIKLQKVIRQIELMFFEECEDLFMLLWE